MLGWNFRILEKSFLVSSKNIRQRIFTIYEHISKFRPKSYYAIKFSKYLFQGKTWKKSKKFLKKFETIFRTYKLLTYQNL
jgi:hypothetical protein